LWVTSAAGSEQENSEKPRAKSQDPPRWTPNKICEGADALTTNKIVTYKQTETVFFIPYIQEEKRYIRMPKNKKGREGRAKKIEC
jgi:hypothetical protein